MKRNESTSNAMRMVSQMIQNDPSTPESVRVEFATLDKMQDVTNLISDASKLILTDHDETKTELNKEWLEYLSLTECGIRSFVDAHGLTIPEEQK